LSEHNGDHICDANGRAENESESKIKVMC
jgi:hypothetical protein